MEVVPEWPGMLGTLQAQARLFRPDALHFHQPVRIVGPFGGHFDEASNFS